MERLTVKRHNSFQKLNNTKTTLTFVPRYLMIELQQEVLKFNDVCLIWTLPKTDHDGDI